MRSFMLMLVSFFLCGMPAGAGDKTYSQADLEALVKSGGWLEILNNARDVKPAARDDRWNQITVQAAQKHLAGLPIDKAPLDALAFCEEVIERYPHLKKVKSFMQARAQAGLKAFPICFNYGWRERCDQAFFRFVSADPDNHELAFKAGKLVRRKMSNFVAAPYFELALRGKPAGKWCAEEDVALAVLAALGVPDKEAEVGPAKKIAFSICFKQLKDRLSKEVVHGNKHYLKNACPGLKSKKALKGIRLKKCNKI